MTKITPLVNEINAITRYLLIDDNGEATFLSLAQADAAQDNGELENVNWRPNTRDDATLVNYMAEEFIKREAPIPPTYYTPPPEPQFRYRDAQRPLRTDEIQNEIPQPRSKKRTKAEEENYRYRKIGDLLNQIPGALKSRAHYEDFLYRNNWHPKNCPDFERVEQITIEDNKIVINEFPVDDTEP